MAKRSPPKLARTGAGNARASKAVAHPCWPGWLERDAVKALLLIIPVILAYHPAWHAGFIWEDDDYVTKDALLTAPDGLWRIWFSYDSPSQYFPLVYSTFRLEHALWGLEPSGYHWVNILFQCADAVLLWQVLRRLEIPGAWLAAAIFAVHPVQVESVAWVTELKNVEMGFFYLLTLLAWMRFTGEGKGRAWGYYGLSLLFYALALCAKTTACTLPVVFLLIDWLRGGRIRWRALIEAAPFFGLGIGMGLLSVLWERYHQGTEGPMFSIGLPERLLVAGRGVWFYLWKLVWPAKLTCSYPRWNLSPADPLAYLWLLGVCGLFALAWWARRFFGRAPLVALSFFVITLGPVLGFIMLYTFRYSFVADHYQYLACIGPIALVSAGCEKAREHCLKRAPLAWAGACGALIAGLALLTWRQSETYQNLETLWRATIARNPGSVLAHNDLSVVLFQAGRFDEAMAESRISLQIDPEGADAHAILAGSLVQKGQVDEAINQYHQALRFDPSLVKARFNLGNLLFRTGHLDEAAADFATDLRFDPTYTDAYYNLAVVEFEQRRSNEAVANLDKALELEPENHVVQGKLAWILAAAPQAAVRDGARAVQLAAEVSQSSGGSDPLILRTLAAAYAQDGQFPAAIQTAQKALQLAEEKKIGILANALHREIDLYEAGKPYSEIH